MFLRNTKYSKRSLKNINKVKSTLFKAVRSNSDAPSIQEVDVSFSSG